MVKGTELVTVEAGVAAAEGAPATGTGAAAIGAAGMLEAGVEAVWTEAAGVAAAGLTPFVDAEVPAPCREAAVGTWGPTASPGILQVSDWRGIAVLVGKGTGWHIERTISNCGD